MLKSIAARIQLPDWARLSPRYVTLDILDRCLDGTFYDHLPYSYYDERKTNGDPVQMADRRPAAQFHLPQLVARSCARKMFSGRHIPRIRNESKKSDALAFEKQMTRSKFWETMTEAATFGSVGAVAVTFCVDAGNVSFSVWRAKYCQPSFDNMGQLSALRVNYVTTASQLESMGFEGLKPDRLYWFIRDFTTDTEVTYEPPLSDDWNPIEGFRDTERQLVEAKDFIYAHDLGFVPGIWFKNLTGGSDPDGICTWRPALENAIEHDYNLSQGGRGVRYNCAPQLVVTGEIVGDSVDEAGNLRRGPADYLQFQSSRKTLDGETIGEGDAKLLEMNGAGTEAALNMTARLRSLALEQICASRKDPEKIKGVLSGRAMEYLDEDFNDLIMELRTSYDPIELLSKVATALGQEDLANGLVSQWPRLYQPTIADIAQLIPALILAVGQDQKESKNDETKDNQDVQKTTKEIPKQIPLLSLAEARAILVANLDLGLMDIESEDAIPDVNLEIKPIENEATGKNPAPVDIAK